MNVADRLSEGVAGFVHPGQTLRGVRRTATAFVSTRITYVVNRDLMKKFKPLHLEMTAVGIHVSAAVEYGAGCGIDHL